MTSSHSSETAPDIGDIREAAGRLAGKAVRTPLLESPLLNERLGGRLLIKAEPLQRTGSFKFRGACNAIAQLDAAAHKAGVVAWSSGNHAQGVAAAAALFGVPALIVMPSDAPAIKIENTRAWGAGIRLYDRASDNREEIGAEIARERGATIIKPYDNGHVIAGQGTVGLEIAAQAGERDLGVDAVAVPCGGGGLTAGIALAMAAESPDTEIWIAEPEGFDDTVLSLGAGERVEIDVNATRSICDALLSPTPGEITFPVNRRLLSGGVAIGDGDVRDAMRTAFREFKLVVEPGGAAALAAVLRGKVDCRGRVVVAVCSGGNVDPLMFAEILSGEKPGVWCIRPGWIFFPERSGLGQLGRLLPGSTSFLSPGLSAMTISGCLLDLSIPLEDGASFCSSTCMHWPWM